MGKTLTHLWCNENHLNFRLLFLKETSPNRLGFAECEIGKVGLHLPLHEVTSFSLGYRSFIQWGFWRGCCRRKSFWAGWRGSLDGKRSWESWEFHPIASNPTVANSNACRSQPVNDSEKWVPWGTLETWRAQVLLKGWTLHGSSQLLPCGMHAQYHWVFWLLKRILKFRLYMKPEF